MTPNAQAAAVEAAVAREEGVGLLGGVRADQEVGHHAIRSGPCAHPAVLAPLPAGGGGRLGGDRLETDAEQVLTWKIQGRNLR